MTVTTMSLTEIDRMSVPQDLVRAGSCNGCRNADGFWLSGWC